MPCPPRSLLGAVLLLVPLLAACDDAPGLPNEAARPAITAFALTPGQDSLATDARTASVPLQATFTLAGDGPIRVRALVRYAGTDTLVASEDVRVEPGAVTLDLPLTLPRGATGDYAVEVSTEGPDRRAGDGARGVFRFRAASLGPPVVTGVEAGTSVTRPTSSTGVVRLNVVAVVTDPDGRENIAAVVLQQPGVGILGELSDGGRDRGDQTADDGRYSGSLQFTRDTPPGTYTLEAVAFDRAGEASVPVAFTFTVQ